MNQEARYLQIIKLCYYDAEICYQVERLANTILGEGYVDERKIRRWFDNQISFYCALDNTGEVCGFCVFLINDFDKISSLMKLPAELAEQYRKTTRKVCYAKSIAIDTKARGIGIANRLFSSCLADSVSLGADSAFGCAWKNGDELPMHKILIDSGFAPIAEIPDAWFDDMEYICSVCNGRCRCTGVVYYKDLNVKA